MLKIKLARFGKKNQPHYRVVVNEARDKRDGSYVDLLGHYAPAQQPKALVIDTKRYDYWISKGAQPTDTVASLYQRSKLSTPFPAKKKKVVKKETKAEVKSAVSTPEVATEPVTERVQQILNAPN